MPRNKTEGDIPFTAVSTGNVDALECVLRKMGVDQAEFTQPSGTGRIQMYRGNGAKDGNNTPNESKLVNTPGDARQLRRDLLFPCWGEDPGQQQQQRQDGDPAAGERNRLHQRGRAHLRDALPVRVALQEPALPGHGELDRRHPVGLGDGGHRPARVPPRSRSSTSG